MLVCRIFNYLINCFSPHFKGLLNTTSTTVCIYYSFMSKAETRYVWVWAINLQPYWFQVAQSCTPNLAL